MTGADLTLVLLLLAVLSQLVPYIGYPRTLNGLAAINEVAPE